MKLTLDIKDSNYHTFLEFIKTLNYVSVSKDAIPEWQKEEVKNRLEDLKQNPESAIDFDSTISNLEQKYGL